MNILVLDTKNLHQILFSFDGEKYLKDGTMKYWIFGHTHEEMDYKEHNVRCICNPLGYQVKVVMVNG